MTERDKRNIKRAMRTLHQVQTRDLNNSKIANTSFTSRQDYKTLDSMPQTAGSQRKKFMAKSKKDLSKNRYQN